MEMSPALACACSIGERTFETCRRWHKQAVATEEISKFGYSGPYVQRRWENLVTGTGILTKNSYRIFQIIHTHTVEWRKLMETIQLCFSIEVYIFTYITLQKSLK